MRWALAARRPPLSAPTARPVTDPAEREHVFAGLLAPLGEFTSKPGQEPEVWVASSPLVEVVFA